jgi:hypothetical protein
MRAMIEIQHFTTPKLSFKTHEIITQKTVNCMAYVSRTSFIVALQGEVNALLRTLSLMEGTPTDLGPGLAMAASNIICALTMSVRFEHNDLRFKRFMDLIEEGFRLFGALETINFIPAVRFVPCFQATAKKLAEVSGGSSTRQYCTHNC